MSTTASSTPEGNKLPGTLSLFSTALSLYTVHRWTYWSYVGWLLVPLTAHILLRITLGESELGSMLDFVVSVVALGLYSWGFAVMALLTFELHEGKDVNAAHHLASFASSRTVPVLVALLVSGLAVLVGAAIVLPAFIFIVWFAFAGIEAALESRGPLDALSASRELSRGRFFAVARRVWAFDITFVALLLVLTAGLSLVFGHDPLQVLTTFAPLPMRVDVLLSVFQVFLLPLWVIYRTLLYLALKVR